MDINRTQLVAFIEASPMDVEMPSEDSLHESFSCVYDLESMS